MIWQAVNGSSPNLRFGLIPTILGGRAARDFLDQLYLQRLLRRRVHWKTELVLQSAKRWCVNLGVPWTRLYDSKWKIWSTSGNSFATWKPRKLSARFINTMSWACETAEVFINNNNFRPPISNSAWTFFLDLFGDHQNWDVGTSYHISFIGWGPWCWPKGS